jgi:hypothetical protein
MPRQSKSRSCPPEIIGAGDFQWCDLKIECRNTPFLTTAQKIKLELSQLDINSPVT